MTGAGASPAGGSGINDVPTRSGFFLGSVLAPDKNATIAAGGSGTGMASLTKATVLGKGSCVVQCQTSDGQWHTYENLGFGPGGLSSWYTLDSAGAAVGGAAVSASPSFAGAKAGVYFGFWSEGPVDPRASAGADLPGPTVAGSGGIAHVTLFNTSLGSGGTGGTWQPSAPESPGTGFSGVDKFLSQFGYFPESPASIRTTLTHDDTPNMYLGMWNQNNQATSSYTYYVDYDAISSTLSGDNVQRPGDGVYGANPMAAGNINDRSIILNRPFRSVGELGYTYRGIEWRTVDFSSAVSADAGLLDLFSISESQTLNQQSTGVYSTPLTAGVVNINTRHPEVLQALLSGSLKNDLDTSAASVISASQANAIATAIVAETNANPLINRSEIVTRLMNLNAVTNSLAGTVSKPEREAVVRALAEPADTRTWNLLIDLDVQAGRYPTSAIQSGTPADLPKFDVQGERRYWLHLAIDRYTGRVINEQLEVVHDN